MNNLEPGLVSIISPGYNSAHFYPSVIDSVLSQTYTNWELLVIIDAGTKDDTEKLINSWHLKDNRIKLLRVPEGKGLALSRNYAMAHAQGEYIAFLDSDDMWMPTKLESQLKFMKENNLAISCTAFRRISEDLKKVGHLIEVPEKITYETLLINNVMGCLTVMINQNTTGLPQFKETKHEDYLLWLSIVKKGNKAGGLNIDLARYRIVQNSRSANKWEMIQFRWRILRDFQGLGSLETMKYLFLYGVTSLKKYAKF